MFTIPEKIMKKAVAAICKSGRAYLHREVIPNLRYDKRKHEYYFSEEDLNTFIRDFRTYLQYGISSRNPLNLYTWDIHVDQILQNLLLILEDPLISRADIENAAKYSLIMTITVMHPTPKGFISYFEKNYKKLTKTPKK